MMMSKCLIIKNTEAQTTIGLMQLRPKIRPKKDINSYLIVISLYFRPYFVK